MSKTDRSTQAAPAVWPRLDGGVRRPPPKRAELPHIWNCWTHNYSSRDDGYITHAFDELSEQYLRHNRTLCGAQIADSGLVALGEGGWKPGCFKCCRTLTNRGLLTPND